MMINFIFLGTGFISLLVGVGLFESVETVSMLLVSTIMVAVGVIFMVVPWLLVFSKEHIILSIFNLLFCSILTVGIFCGMLWMTDVNLGFVLLSDKVRDICVALSLPFLALGGGGSSTTKVAFIIFI